MSISFSTVRSFSLPTLQSEKRVTKVSGNHTPSSGSEEVSPTFQRGEISKSSEPVRSPRWLINFGGASLMLYKSLFFLSFTCQFHLSKGLGNCCAVPRATLFLPSFNICWSQFCHGKEFTGTGEKAQQGKCLPYMRSQSQPPVPTLKAGCSATCL